jgi:hypothetical protein
MNESSLHETQELLKQLNTVTQLINARNEQTTKRIDTSTDALGQSVQQLADNGKRLLDTIRAQGGQAFSQAMGPELDTLQRQIKSSMGLIGQLDQALVEHRHGVYGLIRNALIVLVLGALAVMGAASYVAYDRYRAIENAQFGQDILHATNSGAISRCGGKLCVRTGKKPERYSQNPEYTLVDDK